MREKINDIIIKKQDEIDVNVSEDEELDIFSLEDEAAYSDSDDLPDQNLPLQSPDNTVQNTNNINTDENTEQQNSLSINTAQDTESQNTVNVNADQNVESPNISTNAVENVQIRRTNSEEGFIMDDTAFVSINYLGIDPATGLIEVFVHINKMENFILHRTDTIGTLKQMIFERKGIPVDIQKLVFTGRILKDDTTLTENRIQCGSSIHMFIRIRGGIAMNCNDINEEAHVPNTNTTNYI